MSHLMPTYAPAPVTFVRGQGTLLYDSEGKRYLDFLSGIAVTSLGHSEPGIAEAICSQASRLLHVSNLFHNALAEPLAERIDTLVGDGRPRGGKIFFCNSGAEANECAIKLARRYGSRSVDGARSGRPGGPGRYAVVSALNSFHGRTLATLHATGQPAKHGPFQPLPEGFRHVPFGDLGALAEACAAPEVSAVLLESIQGEGGVVPAPDGYLEGARRICDERGVLLMVDEVQTGLGRTGRWFGFQLHGIEPDVVTVGKALGNGVPIAGCWARAEVADAFQPGDHGSTFGGQPLAVAAATATIDRLTSIDAPARARAAGRHLATALERLDGVEGVRGAGLLLGARLEVPGTAKEVTARALEKGLVVNAPTADVVRLAPPLTVSEAEIDEAVAILGEAVRRVTQEVEEVR